jgi:hypothetical protein
MIELDGNKMTSKHFRHKHPLFRKSSSNTGTSYTQSPYYFWWEFLRRHEGYRETCSSGGYGPLADLYRDFGDVHSRTFREWWSEGDRGATLFAEPSKPIGLDFVQSSDLDRVRTHLDNGDVFLLSIPVTMDKKSIINRFEKLLRRVHPRKRGQRDNMDSHAMYPIVAQYAISSLQKSLEAYDLSKSEPKPTLWEIGQKLKIGDTLTKDEMNLKRGKITPTVKNKQNKLSVAASKKIQLAKSIIEGVGQGVFPKYK